MRIAPALRPGIGPEHGSSPGGTTEEASAVPPGLDDTYLIETQA